MHLNHYAYFDTLAICSYLQKSLEKVSFVEIHLFSYLACLLSLYKGQSVSDWDYDFAIIKEQGYPYSSDLDNAIHELIRKGNLIEKDLYIELTDWGQNAYDSFKEFSLYSIRGPFIDGACSSLLALPVGSIRHAIYQQPYIKGAITLSQSRSLLTDADAGLDALYEQFSALSKAISINVEDLMVPSVVWITYLLEIQNTQEEPEN